MYLAIYQDSLNPNLGLINNNEKVKKKILAYGTYLCHNCCTRCNETNRRDHVVGKLAKTFFNWKLSSPVFH